MAEENEVFAVIGVLLLIVVVIFLVVYVVIPLILFIAGVGVTVGGGVSLFNYWIAFKDNVEPERITS